MSSPADLCHDLDMRTHKTHIRTKGAMVIIAQVQQFRSAHIKHKCLNQLLWLVSAVASTRFTARPVGVVRVDRACEGQPLGEHIHRFCVCVCTCGNAARAQTQERRPTVTHRSTLFVCDHIGECNTTATADVCSTYLSVKP